MNLKGIRKHRKVKTWSNQKKRYISGMIMHLSGMIMHLSGESITKDCYGFDIQINWNEPIQGNDFKYHISGSYSFKDFSKKVTLTL